MKIERNSINWLVPIIICHIVILAWLLNWIYQVNNSATDRGTFGDMFGAVNALFSGLAFAGIIYSLVMQRSDLKLQREELKLQREELKLQRQEIKNQRVESEKQNTAFNKQTELLHQQQFETTFFNLFSKLESMTFQKDQMFESFSALFKANRINVEQLEKDVLLYSSVTRYLYFLQATLNYIENNKPNNPNFYCDLIHDSVSDSVYASISLYAHSLDDSLAETFRKYFVKIN